ncbi:MAG TPA: FMN-binding negative transcriptional regulator [Ferruginibacter sp.]|nr:FMN-binding negative transcriptional regulator [Ferruginibacter sp.]HRO06423.1 FMN-binding negative transcriptional regulator [Ferruginibacter sp.]HRO96489.1 FMN-binding negative transcriptional regulator [Ferruginibacter sp.]HRP50102.1 FMN-binding negative transcriptional regulator [Ferruginibacter sp.]
MYKPPHFTETNRRKLITLIEEYPLGTLMIPVQDDYPEATHLPFMIHEDGEHLILRAHIMKGTGHHTALTHSEKVRVVFQGPQAYISASWYTQPQQASTWNYMTVHALGTVQLLNEEDTLKNIHDLTNQYEPSEAAGAFQNIPDAYIREHLKAIVGIEILVHQLEGVFKLSQNKNEATRTHIIESLRQRNHLQDRLLADAMEKHV